MVKNLPVNTGDIRGMDLIPGLGRSPGGGHDSPLQYSCLEKPRDRGAQQAIESAVDYGTVYRLCLTYQRNVYPTKRHQRAQNMVHSRILIDKGFLDSTAVA